MDNESGYNNNEVNNIKVNNSSGPSQDLQNNQGKVQHGTSGNRKNSHEKNSRMKKQSNASLSSLTSQSSLASRTTEGSTDESPKKLIGKFHQAVRIGTGTKKLLNKWKTHSSSNDTSSVCDGNQTTTEGINGEEVGDGAKKSAWKEHVWSTFIHRGYSDEVTDKEPLIAGKDLLTEFQQDKFKYFFYHVLDLNSDHVISAEDFDKLNDRIKHYMDWSVNTMQFLALKEVHTIFLDNFLTMAAGQTKIRGQWDPFPEPPEPDESKEKHFVTIEEWLDVWGDLVGTARKVDDLPMWLQYYPKTLFDTINRSGSGAISKTELQLFYTAFLDVGKLGEDKINQLADQSFSAMTSNGDIRLDFHIYKLSFLNFLLGRQPNGPGQFIFGLVAPKAGHRLFAVDYSALTVQESPLERETFTVEKLAGPGDRKSIIV